MNKFQIILVTSSEQDQNILTKYFDTHYDLFCVQSFQYLVDHLKKSKAKVVFYSLDDDNNVDNELLGSIIKKNRNTAFICIVHRADIDEILFAFRSGARDCLIRPISKLDVTESITRLNLNRKSLIIEKSKNVLPWIVVKKLVNENRKKHLRDESKIKISSEIKIFFFGHFHVSLNGVNINNWPGKKSKELFAYLCFNRTQKIYRDILIDTFWPDSSFDSARNCLHVTLHNLRCYLQQFDPKNEYILYNDDCYSFNQNLNVQSDIDLFKSNWQSALSAEILGETAKSIELFTNALDVYSGDFIEDLYYEEWIAIEREYFKELYLLILDKVSKYYSENGHMKLAIDLCEKMLLADRCQENIYFREMQCFNKIAQRSQALKVFERCKHYLKHDLDLEPTSSTIELYQNIKNAAF